MATGKCWPSGEALFPFAMVVRLAKSREMKYL